MQKPLTTDRSWQSYDRDIDQHIFAIDGLVHELGIPAEEINRSYREILDEVRDDVSVRAFLPLLVSMGEKEQFGERRSSAR